MNEYDIAKMYQEMELNLISSLKRNLYRHLKEEEKEKITFPQWQALKLKELEKVKAENLEIIKEHTSTIPRDVKRIINREYKQGRTSAQKLYEKTKEGHGSKMNQSFFNINNKKVNALIGEINGTVRTSNSAIFRMMNDKYRSTIFKSAFFLENGAVSLKQAIDMSIKDFIKSGINCIEYADGRRVNIADYTRMAVRTASQRAMLYAEGDYRKEKGYNLVKITKHGTACKLCQPWEKEILIDDVYSGGKPDGKHRLLSEAMKAGLFHPNCRHGAPTYYPELDEVYDDIAKGKTLQEEEEALRDAISQYRQRERREEIWNGKEVVKPNTKINKLSAYIPASKVNKASKIKRPSELEELKDIELYKKQMDRSNIEYKDKFKDVALSTITNVKNKGLNKHIKEEYMLIGNNKYYTNGNYKYIKIIKEFLEHEREIADWYTQTFQEQAILKLTFDNGLGIKNPDMIVNNEIWEIKESIKAKSPENIVKKFYAGQSENIIIDISKNRSVDINEFAEYIMKNYKKKHLSKTKKIIIKDIDRLKVLSR